MGSMVSDYHNIHDPWVRMIFWILLDNWMLSLERVMISACAWMFSGTQRALLSTPLPLKARWWKLIGNSGLGKDCAVPYSNSRICTVYLKRYIIIWNMKWFLQNWMNLVISVMKPLQQSHTHTSQFWNVRELESFKCPVASVSKEKSQAYGFPWWKVTATSTWRMA